MTNVARKRVHWDTRQLAAMALLCSISLLLSFVEFPIFPAAAFLKYDAGFVPVMIGGFAYGPAAGIAIGCVQVVLHGLFMGDVAGSLMNALVVVGFVWPAATMYKHMHTRKGAYLGLALSAVASVACALAGNLVITPLYMGVPLDAVLVMILPILLPFNALKAALNCVLTAIVYKSVSNFIRPKHERTQPKQHELPAIPPLEPTPVAVQFENVSYSYDGTHQALHDVSLAIPTGQFVCILGSNGSGKSTLAKHINALLKPDSGTVRVFGETTANEARVYSIRRTAGLVFQSPDDQLVTSIVRDDVAFGPENLGVPADELAARVDRALQTAGLASLADADVCTLSGGQKQRVAIAGVLAMQPRIIVLDEALSMLDPQGRMDVLRIVLDLHKQGMTLIMITHNLEEAALADRAIVMQDGALVADDTPRAVLADAALLERAHLAYSLANLERS